MICRFENLTMNIWVSFILLREAPFFKILNGEIAEKEDYVKRKKGTLSHELRLLKLERSPPNSTMNS